MRVVAIVTLVLQGACGFSARALPADGSPDQRPSDPDDTDGDGFGVDDNCPDASNPDQRDSDDDRLGDACDSCPMVANPPRETLGHDGPIQRDHDGDGRGDECDLCPHLPSAGDVDTDGDGIGDPCDPEPSVKNPPAYFNGFYDPPDASWQVPRRSGALTDWEVVRRGDAIGWRQRMLDGSRRHQILRIGEKKEHYVDTVMVIDGISASDTTTSLRGAEVSYGFFALNSNDDVYFNCGVRHNNANNTDVIAANAMRNDIAEDDVPSAWSTAVQNVQIHVIGGARRRNSTQPRMGSSNLSCVAGPGLPVTATTQSNFFPDGQFGLRTYGMTVWFDYVFYVEVVAAP